MKTYRSTIFLIAVLLPGLITAQNELPNLGLISQLVEIKYTSEAYLSSALQDHAKSKAAKDSALKNYNAVRVQIDRVIYQLAADMKMKNSINTYKKLHKFYKTHKLSETGNAQNCIEPYVLAISIAHSTYKEKINPDENGKPKAFVEIDAVISLAELSWTIIKDIHDMRAQKVDGIIELLDNLRLTPPSQIEGKDKEEGKKK